MSKRPFNKIRRIEKKENIEGVEEMKEEVKEEEQNVPRDSTGKPPIFSLEKKRKLISNGEALEKKEENAEVQQKNSLSSKPNLFKGRKDGNKLIINSNRNSGPNETVEDNHGEAPKPTPLVIKKRPIPDKNRQRQNVLVEEESTQRLQVEQSKDFNVEESNNFRRKPDLKIKRFLQKKPNSQKINDVEESAEYNQSNDQPFRMESYVPVPIQYREINMQPSTANISQGRIDKQRKRTNELKNLLNLESDLYEQTLSISSVTAYQIYINKIKSGFLKNSNDQAFDDTTSNSCQTLSFQYTDFVNQCPQDYSIDIGSISKIDNNDLFNQFILKIAPVVEQLIKPTANITEPPIFLLAFRPSFKTFLKCPYPVFIYRSQQYNLDLIVMGEKLYITEGEIESVLMIGKNILAGLKNGYIVLWNGQNNKSSRLYEQIKQFTQSTNFELPSFSTHELERYSAYSSEFSITSLVHLERGEFLSLDQTGKVIRWCIEDTINNTQVLRHVSIIQLRNLTQHDALQAYQLKRRGETYYVNTSVGIICLHNQEIKQKLDAGGINIVTFEVPKKTALVYAICENNTLIIFNEQYSHKLFEMNLQIGTQQLKEIIMPELQHQNREILFLFVVYLVDSLGRIYEVKLLENKFEFLQKMSEEQSDNRRDKNIIFKGVNRSSDSLQTIKLMRDLKITSANIKMNVSMQKNVPNLKSIVEKNREMMAMLEYQNVMIF